jgi:hypothetical protein
LKTLWTSRIIPIQPILVILFTIEAITKVAAMTTPRKTFGPVSRQDTAAVLAVVENSSLSKEEM